MVLQGSSRYCHIVECALAAGAFLIGFVTFAGNQHDVSGMRHLQRGANRSFAIALNGGFLRPGHASQNLRDDYVAVFAARVVIGDDGDVRQSLGDLAHLRSLACVALAAATKHAD